MSHYDDMREKDVKPSKRPAVKKAKKKTGRPKVDIDYKTLDKLCGIQCTGEECAAILGMDYDTLNAALKRDGNKSFSDYFTQKGAHGKMSLRRRQYEVANSGNPTMLIWLGKQWLGQEDKSKLDLSSSDGSMTPGKNLSDEELLRIASE